MSEFAKGLWSGVIITAIAVMVAFHLFTAKQDQPQTFPDQQPPQTTVADRPETESVATKPESMLPAEIPEIEPLQEAYKAKLANKDYVAWKSLPGIPNGYQDYPEEQQIKVARAQLAQIVKLPDDIMPVHIPIVPNIKPIIDGKLDQAEWAHATKLPIGTNGARVNLFLQSDGTHLYLGCDALDEKTETGFDQFRFYYHIDVAGVVINERIHVGRGRDDVLGGIRQTTIRWPGDPPAGDDERWKRFAISDWRIYRKARGLSRIDNHRQYEVKLDLDEIGLYLDTPFPAFAEVESDPVYRANGKFDHRTYIGLLATQGSPQWFLIDSTLATGEHRVRDSNATIYRWIDKKGNIQFSDQPPPKKIR